MAVIKRFWGHLMVEVTWLLIVAGVALVGLDWLHPATRLRAIGLLVFCAGLALAILMRIDSCVGKAWTAGGRARERQLRLEQSTPDELAVVHEMKR